MGEKFVVVKSRTPKGNGKVADYAITLSAVCAVNVSALPVTVSRPRPEDSFGAIVNLFSVLPLPIADAQLIESLT